MSPAETRKSRVAYIDWMRGLACLLMFQTHCYDSWLGGPARQSRFFMYSQLGGTFPAPLFLFLAGISFALVTEKLIQKNIPAAQIARTTIRRGAEIFGFGLLFRLQEYVISWGWAPKSDLLRVDILNTIGLSMMLMGVLCWMVQSCKKHVGTAALGCPAGRSRPRTSGCPILAASFAARVGNDAAVSSPGSRRRSHRPPDLPAHVPCSGPPGARTWLPWPLESYINGVHNLGTSASLALPHLSLDGVRLRRPRRSDSSCKAHGRAPAKPASFSRSDSPASC